MPARVKKTAHSSSIKSSAKEPGHGQKTEEEEKKEWEEERGGEE